MSCDAGQGDDTDADSFHHDPERGDEFRDGHCCGERGDDDGDELRRGQRRRWRLLRRWFLLGLLGGRSWCLRWSGHRASPRGHIKEAVLAVADRWRLRDLHGPGAFTWVGGAPFGEAAVVGGHVHGDGVTAKDLSDEHGTRWR